MNALHRFQVPGEPVAKGRPRARIVAGHASMYTPAKTLSWERRVREAAEAAGVELMQGPLSMTLIAYWEWPRSSWRKREPRREEWRDGGPDADNIAKGVCDALNGVAYLDDRQVAELTVRKRRAAQGEPARTLVIIQTLGGPPPGDE